MKFSNTEKCTFCIERKETIDHLLVSCKYAIQFWEDVISWLEQYKIKEETRGSLSLYSWYAWDRGQIPNMAVTEPNR